MITLGGQIFLSSRANLVQGELEANSPSGRWLPRQFINASGTQADCIAKFYGCVKARTIIAFLRCSLHNLRAQLVNLQTGLLVNDFMLEGDQISTYVLNAVSSGWTAALSFGAHIAERVLLSLN